MSRRLQVILDDEEMREIRRIARRKHLTVAERVRQALRAARKREPRADSQAKLACLEVATRHAFPTADIPRMLREVESGYLSADET